MSGERGREGRLSVMDDRCGLVSCMLIDARDRNRVPYLTTGSRIQLSPASQSSSSELWRISYR